MTNVNLSKSEINQITMCLVAYRSMFKNLSVSMPLTDSLIEKFNQLNK